VNHDTATKALGSSHIAVGCEPTGIAITPDGRYAYVATSSIAPSQ